MEEQQPRLVSSRRPSAGGAWSDPRFWVQIAVLLGGLLTIYFTDRSNDQAQVLAVSAATQQLVISQSKIEGQVNNISGSVQQLSTGMVGLQKDIESTKQRLDDLNDELHELQAYQSVAQKDIARLQAQVGR